MLSRFKQNKFCLVLGGGGSKGAYQAGVWTALREEGIKLEAIIGTSVGAINGAFFATSKYKDIINGWYNLKAEQFFNIKYDENSKFSLLKELTRQFIELGGIDTSPMRQYIERLTSEEKIRKSKIDFGLVTFRLNDLKPIEYFRENIPQGQIIDYILASSALPGLKPTDIDGKRFADGGFYDVVPYNTARKRGYKNIIAVDISGVGIDRKDQTEGGVTIYIKNSQDTGGVVDFNPETLSRNIRMGYLDAKKVFGCFDSIDYFFSLDKKVNAKFENLLKNENVVGVIKKYIKVIKSPNEQMSISNQIREIVPAEMKVNKNLLVVLVECAAEMLQIDKLQYDNMKDLLNEIRNRLDEIKSGGETSLDMRNFFDKIKLISGVINSAVFNSKDLIKYILNHQDSLRYLKMLHSFYPKLVAALIFFEIVDLL